MDSSNANDEAGANENDSSDDDVYKTTRYVGVCIPTDLSRFIEIQNVPSHRKTKDTLTQQNSFTKMNINTPEVKRPWLATTHFRGLNDNFNKDVFKMKTSKVVTSNISTYICTPESLSEEISSMNDFSGDEVKNRLHEKILSHVISLGSSVGVKVNETALLMMKEKRPDVFDSISLYNSVLQVMSEYSFRLTTRRFVQELFQDIKFTEVYLAAQSALKTLEQKGQSSST